MNEWSELERTVILDEEAYHAMLALAMLTGVDRNEVASNLVIEGAESSLRKAKLINVMRGAS